MILTIARNLLGDNVKILKSKASKTAYQGVLLGVAAIIITTCMVILIPVHYLWRA